MPACSVRVSGCKRARTHARMTCRNLCYGQTRSRCWSKRDGGSSKLRWTSRTSCLELCCRPTGSYLLASEVHEGAYNLHASKAHKDDINSDLFVFLHREQRREWSWKETDQIPWRLRAHPTCSTPRRSGDHQRHLIRKISKVFVIVLMFFLLPSKCS